MTLKQGIDLISIKPAAESSTGNSGKTKKSDNLSKTDFQSLLAAMKRNFPLENKSPLEKNFPLGRNFLMAKEFSDKTATETQLTAKELVDSVLVMAAVTAQTKAEAMTQQNTAETQEPLPDNKSIDKEDGEEEDFDNITAMQNSFLFSLKNDLQQEQIKKAEIQNSEIVFADENQNLKNNTELFSKLNTSFMQFENTLKTEQSIDTQKENFSFQAEPKEETILELNENIALPSQVNEAVKDFAITSENIVPNELLADKLNLLTAKDESPPFKAPSSRFSADKVSEVSEDDFQVNPDIKVENTHKNKQEISPSSLKQDRKTAISDLNKTISAEKEQESFKNIADFKFYQSNNSISKPKDISASDKVAEREPIMQLADKTLEALNQNKSSFKMKLRPEGLGEITVDITFDNGKLNLKIRTEFEATKSLLESQLHFLQTELKSNDYPVNNLDITNGSSKAFNFESFQFDGKQNNRGQAFSDTGKKKDTDLRQKDNITVTYSPIRVFSRGKLNYKV